MKVLVSHNLEIEKSQFQTYESLTTQSCDGVISHFDLSENLMNFEISVFITDDQNIQELNKSHRNKDKPTNVLSFPFFDFDEGKINFDLSESHPENMIGEIVISLETCEREVGENKKQVQDHFSHLVVHSVLHILGFDHISDEDAEKMESVEIEILEKMGIDDPYIIQD